MKSLSTLAKRLINFTSIFLFPLSILAQIPKDSLTINDDNIEIFDSMLEKENEKQENILHKSNLKQKANVVRRTKNKRHRNVLITSSEDEKNANVIKQKEFNDELRQNTYHAPWKRIIYREINIDSANNSVLYYPPRATDHDANLFTIIFRLINKGTIRAYEYIDGTEIFDKKHEIKFGEFLDRFGIYASIDSTRENIIYNVSNSDIPSDLIKTYYIKEEYYFDPINSCTDIKILAICPVLYDNIEHSEMLKFPLFWVKFDDIRFYLNEKKVMFSELNNTEDLTLDSFFRLGMYQGNIYKTMNLQGRSLAQYCPTPDSLYREQQKIETQLKSFESRLWSRVSKEQKKNLGEASDKTDEQKDIRENKEADTSRARRQQLITENKNSSKWHKSEATTKHRKNRKTKSSKKSVNAKRSARSRF